MKEQISWHEQYLKKLSDFFSFLQDVFALLKVQWHVRILISCILFADTDSVICFL